MPISASLFDEGVGAGSTHALMCRSKPWTHLQNYFTLAGTCGSASYTR